MLSVNRANDWADAAMASMRDHGIPPTPENFTIWFHYHAGENLELSRSIDILLSNCREFTQELSDDLHEKFFGMQEQADMVRNTGAKIEASVESLLGTMRSADDGASRYGEALDSFRGQLVAADTGQASELVGQVLDETRKVQEQNEQLQQRLRESSGEITELRGNLETMRREAMTDGLTGIANRKFFDQAFRQAAAEAMEAGNELSLLILDIDHFKKFNDSFGHPLGDQVLRLVARTMTDSVKGRDLAARYGGEEFVVILRETALKNALTVGEQIRKAVASKKIIKKATGEDLGKITVSIGAARFVPGEPLEEVVRRADEALYAAKEQGRNCVVAEADRPAKLQVAGT